MTTKQRLRDDLKSALRARDERRKAVIRLALAAIVNAEVAQRSELTDSEVVVVLRKQVRQRRESIEELQRVDRPGRLAGEESELKILEEYLPELLSRQEIVEEASRAIVDAGATGLGQMGVVMGQLMSKLKGRADGRVVSQVVRELLSG